MALAYDTTGGTEANASSITFSHTCSGSNRILFVGVSDETGTDAEHVTGVTYASVAMTKIDSQRNSGASPNYFEYLYYLINPASGANNVVVSANEVVNLRAISLSYTGALQSGQPDAFGKATSATTDLSVSVTVVASNCWIVSVGQGLGTTPTAGTGITSRNNLNNIRVGDSNGVVATGVNTVHWTNGTSLDMAGISASFAPAPEAGTTGLQSKYW